MIYQKVLARAFKSPFFDIDDGFLPKDYASLYRLARKLYVEEGKVPSLTHVMTVVLPNTEMSRTIRKKFLAILGNLPPVVEESDLELKEILQQEATTEQLADLVVEAKVAVEEKNIKKVGEVANKMQGVILLGDNNILAPDNDSFLEDEQVEYIRTGLETGNEVLDRIPTGSAILLTAGPGKGKSIMSGKMLNNKFFLEDESVLYYSYEVQSEVMRARFLSNLSGVPFEEIANGKYTTKENLDRIQAAKLCYVHQITPAEAFALADKGQQDKIKTLPKRKNVFKLRAMPSRKDIQKAKNEGKRIVKMPNREKLLEEFNLFYQEYGTRTIAIDLVTSVPAVGKEERYQTIFSCFEDSKNWALGVGGLIIAPAQAEENDITVVKYAKMLKEQSDMNLVALPVPSHLNDFQVMYWGMNKNRHGIEGMAYPFMDLRANSDFVYADDRANVESMWDIVKAYYKERGKK